MTKPTYASTYTVDVLTCEAADIETQPVAGNFQEAVAAALQTYYQIAADDAEHVIGLWTQDYQLVGLIYAAQLFVPEKP